MSTTVQYIGNLPVHHRLLAYPAPGADKRKSSHTGPRRLRRQHSVRRLPAEADRAINSARP